MSSRAKPDYRGRGREASQRRNSPHPLPHETADLLPVEAPAEPKASTPAPRTEPVKEQTAPIPKVEPAPAKEAPVRYEMPDTPQVAPASVKEPPVHYEMPDMSQVTATRQEGSPVPVQTARSAPAPAPADYIDPFEERYPARTYFSAGQKRLIVIVAIIAIAISIAAGLFVSQQWGSMLAGNDEQPSTAEQPVTAQAP